MAAQVKLAEEITPDELAAHAGSDNPVAAAIAARRQQLAAVKDAHDRWVPSGMCVGVSVSALADADSPYCMKLCDVTRDGECGEGSSD
jgi:hypothetical protein